MSVNVVFACLYIKHCGKAVSRREDELSVLGRFWKVTFGRWSRTVRMSLTTSWSYRDRDKHDGWFMLEANRITHCNSRESIPWRSWSTVSISRHIYFCHERMPMTLQTNMIFLRFFFTQCYLMLTFLEVCRYQWIQFIGVKSLKFMASFSRVLRLRFTQPAGQVFFDVECKTLKCGINKRDYKGQISTV